MKNICLVQVVDNYGPNKFLPLAISYQWLTAKKNPVVASQWQVQQVLIEKVNINHWLNEFDSAPDVMAMSCYVWNWEFNQELAKQVKTRWPSCVIVVGGPQITKHDVDFVRKHPWFDIAVLGENEQLLEKILLGESIEDLTQLPGVVTSLTQQLSDPPRTAQLDELPSPILEGFYDWIMDSYESKHNQKFNWQVTYETMRGCPYHCAFCDIGDDYWNKTKLFSLDRIRKEIKWLSQRQIEYVSVCDSNWGLFERDFEITQWVVDTKKSTGYPKFWDVTWAKNNPDRVQRIVMLDHVANTRLFKGVTFAMQSMDTVTLDSVARFNIKDGATYDAMQFYYKNNVPTYSELIWPLPGETLTTFKCGIQHLIDLGQRDFLMVHPLVLTHNAPMGQPEFRQHHNLETQYLPLDTFWLEIADPKSYIVEKVDIVRSTDQISFDEMISGHMVSHWIVVLYFYGWAHHVMNYLRKVHGVAEIDFVVEWMKYFESENNLVATEHTNTIQAIKDVFENDAVWGRRVSGTDEIYWEFKSATSVVVHRNRKEFQQCLTEFLFDVYGLECAELVDLNMNLCVDWQQQYPMKQQYSDELIKTVLGLPNGDIVINHWDQSITSDDQFIKVAYHYQRKNRYWRCITTCGE